MNFYIIDEFSLNSIESRDYRPMWLTRSKIKLSRRSLVQIPKPNFIEIRREISNMMCDTLTDTLRADLFVLSIVCKELHQTDCAMSGDCLYKQFVHVKFHFWQSLYYLWNTMFRRLEILIVQFCLVKGEPVYYILCICL